jgi:hypothetical protein
VGDRSLYAQRFRVRCHADVCSHFIQQHVVFCRHVWNVFIESGGSFSQNASLPSIATFTDCSVDAVVYTISTTPTIPKCDL